MFKCIANAPINGWLKIRASDPREIWTFQFFKEQFPHPWAYIVSNSHHFWKVFSMIFQQFFKMVDKNEIIVDAKIPSLIELYEDKFPIAPSWGKPI